MNADALDFALCNGCERGRLVFVDQLLSAHPPVNAAPRDNQPIRIAARHGHVALVDRLLGLPADRGVDPSACDNEALRSAAERGYATVVERLLADPRVDPSAREHEAVESAARNGDVATLRLLLVDPRVRISECGDAALSAAAAHGHLAAVEVLLGLPFPQLRPAAALHEAMSHGHEAVGRRIGADPRVRPASWSCYGTFRGAPFKAELARGDAAAEDIRARLSSDASVDPSYNCDEALCEAARLGHVRIIEVLLADPRVSPNSRDGDALRYESEAGHVRVVERLLAHPGTDSSLLHHFALHRALSGEHFPIVRTACCWRTGVLRPRYVHTWSCSLTCSAT